MIIHEPIEFDEYRDLELQALADRVRDIILSRYELQ